MPGPPASDETASPLFSFSLGGRGFSPGASHPQTNLPQSLSPPQPTTGDFNRQERLFSVFLSAGGLSVFTCPLFVRVAAAF
jgi:hypothetical protein